MIEKIRNVLKSRTVDLIETDGDNQITRISYVSGAERQINQVVNGFDLLGYEIHSDDIEIFFRGKCLGRGYIADIAGVTLNIEQPIPHEPEWYTQPVSEGEIPDYGSAKVTGIGYDNVKRPRWFGGQERTIPVMIIEGAPKVRVVRFEYLREIEGGIIDDDKQIRYEKDPEMQIEITMPDGKTGPGYILGQSGKTIQIRREVSITRKITKTIDGKEVIEDEQVRVKFSGALGKLSAGDRLPKLLSGMAGRENTIQIIIAFLAGVIVMAVI